MSPAFLPIALSILLMRFLRIIRCRLDKQQIKFYEPQRLPQTVWLSCQIYLAYIEIQIEKCVLFFINHINVIK